MSKVFVLGNSILDPLANSVLATSIYGRHKLHDNGQELGNGEGINITPDALKMLSGKKEITKLDALDSGSAGVEILNALNMLSGLKSGSGLRPLFSLLGRGAVVASPVGRVIDAIQYGQAVYDAGMRRAASEKLEDLSRLKDLNGY
jgi:hypothetical protein